jgi:membrane protein implicated in regulation of membrane protease activity
LELLDLNSPQPLLKSPPTFQNFFAFDPDKTRKDKNIEISGQSINLNRGNAASQIAQTDNYTSTYFNQTGVNIMFNVVKAFGSIFSTKTYSTQKNMLIDNYINTNFNYFNEEAVVDESIFPNQTGRVRFQGSWWPARCDRQMTFTPGDTVYVIGVDSITLLVSLVPAD